MVNGWTTIAKKPFRTSQEGKQIDILNEKNEVVRLFGPQSELDIRKIICLSYEIFFFQRVQISPNSFLKTLDPDMIHQKYQIKNIYIHNILWPPVLRKKRWVESKMNLVFIVGKSKRIGQVRLTLKKDQFYYPGFWDEKSCNLGLAQLNQIRQKLI